MSLPTIEEITNLYLFGQKTKPTDLLNDELIRTNPTPSQVYTYEYMTSGPGRFSTIDKLNSCNYS